MPGSRPTPKERVRKVWPASVCLIRAAGYSVWHRIDTAGEPLGRGTTERAAWAAAAKTLGKKK